MKFNRTFLLFGALLAIIAVVSVGAAEPATKTPGLSDASAYEFTLNGKPFTPDILSMHGDPAHPQPGDLLCAGRLVLTLGPERACHFITTPQEDGRVLLQLANGQKRVVGVNVTWSIPDRQKVIFNPLAKLSSEEIRGLWGIYLDEWPEGVEEKLKHVDPARACITLTDGTANRKEGELPALPPEVRYLVIAEHSNMGIRDYQSLRGLSQLRLLMVRAMTAKAFDAELIAQNKQLRYLDLKTRSLRHPEALAGLDQAAWIDLAYIPDLATVEFAGKMKHLRRLNVGRTKVRDLSPLAGLEKLEEVKASMAPVEKLPDRPLPALRSMGVFSTRLSEPAVAAFTRLNPKCTVLFRWDEALRQAVAGATRLRIRSGGTCHRNPSRETTLWELKDPAKIRDFVALIHIDERQSGFECMCCGEPTFEFYQGDRLIAMVGFHHGRSLRWQDGWPGDGLLTPEPQDRLPKWLAENGFDALQKVRETEASEKEQERKQRQRFLSFFPEKVRPMFDYRASSLEDEPKQGQRIAKAIGDPVQTVRVACRALGDKDGPWSFLDFDDQLTFSAANAVAESDFLKALEQIHGDRIGELGAARLCFAQGYLKKLPQPKRSEWAVILAEAVLNSGRAGNRTSVIPPLERLADPRCQALLRRIARGEIPKENRPWDDGHGEPGLRADAYLALATQGDQEIKGEVEKLLAVVKKGSDRAALEVCLALLGDPKYIKREHFGFESYRIGFAAIWAIEKFGGREGMDVLVEAGFEHPWAAVNEEAILAVQRVTGQTWCKDPERERAYNHRKDVEKWWHENGAEFVKRRRAEK